MSRGTFVLGGYQQQVLDVLPIPGGPLPWVGNTLWDAGEEGFVIVKGLLWDVLERRKGGI